MNLLATLLVVLLPGLAVAQVPLFLATEHRLFCTSAEQHAALLEREDFELSWRASGGEHTVEMHVRSTDQSWLVLARFASAPDQSCTIGSGLVITPGPPRD